MCRACGGTATADYTISVQTSPRVRAWKNTDAVKISPQERVQFIDKVIDVSLVPRRVPAWEGAENC